MKKGKSENKNKPLQIKVLVDEDELRKFNFIKKKHGVKANAEVVRILIAKEYERIQSRSD